MEVRYRHDGSCRPVLSNHLWIPWNTETRMAPKKKNGKTEKTTTSHTIERHKVSACMCACGCERDIVSIQRNQMPGACTSSLTHILSNSGLNVLADASLKHSYTCSACQHVHTESWQCKQNSRNRNRNRNRNKVTFVLCTTYIDIDIFIESALTSCQCLRCRLALKSTLWRQNLLPPKWHPGCPTLVGTVQQTACPPIFVLMVWLATSRRQRPRCHWQLLESNVHLQEMLCPSSPLCTLLLAFSRAAQLRMYRKERVIE